MDFLNFFNKNLSIAFGCTEPVAVAFTAANASKLIDGPIRKIEIITDRNIFKNGFGAGIPGSNGKTGNLYAAALGALIKDPDKGFRIFSDIDSEFYSIAQTMLNEDRISLNVDKSKTGIYIYVKIFTYEDDYAVAEVQDDHLNLITLIKNGTVIYKKEEFNSDQSDNNINQNEIDDISFTDIYDIVENLTEKDLLPIQEVIDTNLKAADFGINNPSGIKLGYHLSNLIKSGKICDSVENKIKMYTAGACDARMGGENIGVMTLCGSGNQGIAASIPVIIYKQSQKDISDTKLKKALAFSFLVTAYIKRRLGKLSPICGCVVASGSGAAAGISYLMNENLDHINNAICDLLGDITGVICDGAKGSCTLKLATAVSSAYTYALLAQEGCVVNNKNGIIESTIEKTIENLRKIAFEGMKNVDNQVVEIFEEKLKEGYSN